jgi:hypothetical protein
LHLATDILTASFVAPLKDLRSLRDALSLRGRAPPFATILTRSSISPAELRAWLETPESRRVGVVRRGETESVGRLSARQLRA